MNTYLFLTKPDNNKPSTNPINIPTVTFLINNPRASPNTTVNITAIILRESSPCLLIKMPFSCLKLSNLPANDMHPARLRAVL